MSLPVYRKRPEHGFVQGIIQSTLRWIHHVPVQFRMKVDPEYPWLNHQTVLWLKANLKRNMIGFEWGSGRSTHFFAKQIKWLESVEHVKKWHRRVRLQLAENKIVNVNYHFIPTAENVEPDKRRPQYWENPGREPRKPEFTRYFDFILNYPDEFFDFILVDGRARVECLFNARNKVKPGGFIILDNSEWPKYTPGMNLLSTWKRLDHCNGVWRTTVFIKPA